jgi:3'(2'), 5'-bisphosphate nucleotidase
MIWTDVTEDDAMAAIDIGAQSPTGRFWTLDPIDGTKGFMRNGQYAVSLALIENGKVVFGALGCPNLSADFDRPFDDPDPHGLIIHATRGAGAWAIPADAAGAMPSVVRYAPADDGAFRICGSAASGHSDQQAANRVVAALGGARVAHLDSQAKYAVVARGQADCYLRIPLRAEDREYIWDHAPGEIIAIEAGTVVSDIRGRAFDFGVGDRLDCNGGILCAAPAWHPRILKAIAEDPQVTALLRARDQ